MTEQHTNREQLVSKLGKHNANRLEWKVTELCKLADELNVHIVFDYGQQGDHSVNVIIKNEPEICEQIVEVSADRIEDEERRHIINALHLTQGNIQKAAELLGMSERNLHRKCKEYTIIFAKRK